MRTNIGRAVLVAAGVLVSCSSTQPPVLALVSPDRGFSTTASFTLTARGSNFQNDSQIVFNQRAKATTFVSATELACTITPSDMTATPGPSQIVAVPVYVATPQTANSGSLDFSIAIYPRFPAASKIADSTTSYSDTLHPLIRIDAAGQLDVVWRDQRKLLFSFSRDGGARWSPPEIIHESPASSYRFSASVDRSSPVILVAWEEDSAIALIRSTDSGQTWSSPAALTSAATISASNPGMLVDPSGTIFVAYLGSSPRGGGSYAVVILRSSDHGASFRQVGRIPWSTYFVGETSPQLGVDKTGVLYLVFTSELGTRYSTSYLASSTDGGLNWSTPSRVSLAAPSLAVDDRDAVDVVGANMYLPYQYSLTFMRSTDRGGSWASHEFEGTSYSVSDIVVNAFGSTDLVWANRFVRSFDHGSTWGPIVDYADEGEADQPSFVEDSSGRIYIAWWDPSGGIYFKASGT